MLLKKTAILSVSGLALLGLGVAGYLYFAKPNEKPNRVEVTPITIYEKEYREFDTIKNKVTQYENYYVVYLTGNADYATKPEPWGIYESFEKAVEGRTTRFPGENLFATVNYVYEADIKELTQIVGLHPTSGSPRADYINVVYDYEGKVVDYFRTTEGVEP